MDLKWVFYTDLTKRDLMWVSDQDATYMVYIDGLELRQLSICANNVANSSNVNISFPITLFM